jgi:hypothetical protein
MVYFGIGGGLGGVTGFLGIVTKMTGLREDPLPEIAGSVVPRSSSNHLPISISAETS